MPFLTGSEVSLFLVARPGATSSFLAPSSDAFSSSVHCKQQHHIHVDSAVAIAALLA